MRERGGGKRKGLTTREERRKNQTQIRVGRDFFVKKNREGGGVK